MATSSKVKIGDHVINADHVVHVDTRYRTQQPDRSKWEKGTQGFVEDAVRIQLVAPAEEIVLFGDEAEAFRKHLDKDAHDISPKKKKGDDEPATDAITAELDATIGHSGITDAERLHAATSAGQDRPGAADLRPPGAKSGPAPGTSPDAEVIVPARTAGLRETPVEAKGVVAAAETVRADDERRAQEARERQEAKADAGAVPKYPSDRSGEAAKDEPGKLKEDDKKPTRHEPAKGHGHGHGK